MDKKGITVYCASSTRISEEYFEAARELGRLIAEAQVPLINGGGKMGLMGAVNQGCLDAGGYAVGVIPQFMVERGWHHSGLSEMVVTDGMHQRKEFMAANARGVIALPGGCGTFEELLEMITWRQLGLFSGNVVILNIASYYDPLIELFNKAISLGFMKEDHRRIWHVATTPAEALEIALAEPYGPKEFAPKF